MLLPAASLCPRSLLLYALGDSSNGSVSVTDYYAYRSDRLATSTTSDASIAVDLLFNWLNNTSPIRLSPGTVCAKPMASLITHFLAKIS